MTPPLTESAPIGTGQVWTVNGHRVSRPDDRNWVVESDDMHGPAYFWRFDRMMAYCSRPATMPRIRSRMPVAPLLPLLAGTDTREGA